MTDYGTFLGGDVPDFRVIHPGNNPVPGKGTICWTCVLEISGNGPDVVLVRVSVEDTATEKVLATAEETLARTEKGVSN